MENWPKSYPYCNRNGGTVYTHYGTHRSSYNKMGMISANYGKFFVLLYPYGERCTHIWYTPFLLQYGYDFPKSIMENFLYTFYSIEGNGVHTFVQDRCVPNVCIRGTVYTHLVHRSP